ncbi:branched-chain amino acid ABC transporter permease, partial [Candidatus Bipolaricaulota bacterium]|nr:branched-chain amino acid ABC transporter permease [Candidatus Bipolaricaulota bacterium]
MQVIFNSLIRAAELGLLAVGLTMVYDLLKFANFSHTSFAAI